MPKATNFRALRSKVWAIRFLILQLLLALATWAASVYEIESIVFTGPALAIVGLVFGVAAWPLGLWVPVLFGLSAPIASAISALTIALFRLNPAQAKEPIPVMLGIYLLLCVPVWIFVFVQFRQWPDQVSVSRKYNWQFSLKSLLVTMTAVAMTTGLLASAARRFYDFQIVFSGFGILCLLLSGMVAWRFYAHRRSRPDFLPAAVD